MYTIFRKCIPEELINNVIYYHEKFKSSPFSIFRAQGTNAFENPILDEFGNQLNSIQNPNLLGFSRNFRKGLNKIIFHENISKSLFCFARKDSST